MKLNLGCPWKEEGWITVDVIGEPDMKLNLNESPYPFETNSVDVIKMKHTLHCLNEPKKVIMELHRILKPGGKVIITVPYGNTSMINPNILHDFLPNWFKEFDKSISPYNQKLISGKFQVSVSIKRGKIRFWKPYEITAEMTKNNEL